MKQDSPHIIPSVAHPRLNYVRTTDGTIKTRHVPTEREFTEGLTPHPEIRVVVDFGDTGSKVFVRLPVSEYLADHPDELQTYLPQMETMIITMARETRDAHVQASHA
jgi:hypothetical protein